MKILIIRHGDPNYALDTLTEKGWKEAELLAERIAAQNVKAYYVSPMGRAQDTASVTLKKTGQSAETLGWLREFDVYIQDMTTGEPCLVWELQTGDWTQVPEFYDKDKWCDVPVMKEHGVKERWESICSGLDAVLENYGYKREGNYYRAVQPNEDTIVFFCHYGVGCAMIAHLLGMSPMQLWYGFSMEPTAVTTIHLAPKQGDIAGAHVSGFGDLGHLRK